jgi:hypothetical protein
MLSRWCDVVRGRNPRAGGRKRAAESPDHASPHSVLIGQVRREWDRQAEARADPRNRVAGYARGGIKGSGCTRTRQGYANLSRNMHLMKHRIDQGDSNLSAASYISSHPDRTEWAVEVIADDIAAAEISRLITRYPDDGKLIAPSREESEPILARARAEARKIVCGSTGTRKKSRHPRAQNLLMSEPNLLNYFARWQRGKLVF